MIWPSSLSLFEDETDCVTDKIFTGLHVSNFTTNLDFLNKRLYPT